MRTLFSLVVAYIFAAPLTSLISLDLRATEWTNILTYVIWACSGLIWIAIFYVVVLVIAGIAVAMDK